VQAPHGRRVRHESGAMLMRRAAFSFHGMREPDPARTANLFLEEDSACVV
jgi:hypothetical protein